MFVDEDRDLPTHGAAYTDGVGGVGSARWFRSMQSRKPARPEHLDYYVLRGPRVTGPVRVIILQDRSGSMESFAAMRAEVLEELIAWAPEYLRADDEVAIVDFSDHAGIALKPTTVAMLENADVVDGAGTGGTQINPAMFTSEPLVDDTRLNWFVAISDGEIFDRVPLAISELVDSPMCGGMILINPAYASLPARWEESFPASLLIQMVGLDAGGVAVSVGQALATITGQDLVRRGRRKPKKKRGWFK